jgi:hypothetical protein
VKIRAFRVFRGFRLNGDRLEALSYVISVHQRASAVQKSLQLLCLFAANESVFIRVHPWLNYLRLLRSFAANDFVSFVCFAVKKYRHLAPALSPFEAERVKHLC